MPILTAEERLGTLLAGRYRIESLIGRGGMGVVLRAKHELTGRAVAVKLLLPGLSSDHDAGQCLTLWSSAVHPGTRAIDATHQGARQLLEEVRGWDGEAEDGARGEGEVEDGARE